MKKHLVNPLICRSLKKKQQEHRGRNNGHNKEYLSGDIKHWVRPIFGVVINGWKEKEGVVQLYLSPRFKEDSKLDCEAFVRSWKICIYKISYILYFCVLYEFFSTTNNRMIEIKKMLNSF